MKPPRKYADPKDKICANVDIVDAPHWMDNELGPCWIWKRALNARGYGRASVYDADRKGMRKILAHRLVLNLFFGTDLRTLECSMHQCSVKRCCNPLHLLEGNESDNRRFYYEVEKPMRQAIQEAGG